MLEAIAFTAWMMAPPVTPTQDSRTIGPFKVEQRSGLQWPGVSIPSFSPRLSKRWVHRFSLSLALPKAPRLGAIRFDVVSIGPSLNPEEINRAHAFGRGRDVRPEIRFEGGVLVPGPRNVRVGVASTFAGIASGLFGRGVFVDGRL